MNQEGSLKKGRRGEDEACRLLEKLGHTVIERNFRKRHTELDIVSLDRRGIHFVEVKARTAPATADPLENVGPVKMRNMVRAAQDYIHSGKCPYGEQEFFFDVVSVLFYSDRTETEYFPEAFIPFFL